MGPCLSATPETAGPKAGPLDAFCQHPVPDYWGPRPRADKTKAVQLEAFCHWLTGAWRRCRESLGSKRCFLNQACHEAVVGALGILPLLPTRWPGHLHSILGAHETPKD